MFLKFSGMHGETVMVNVNDIYMVIKKGDYCDIYIRGITDRIRVKALFAEVDKNINQLLAENASSMNKDN
ncbi:hypothetical protein ACFMH7_004967 [Escherichia coli O8:H49]